VIPASGPKITPLGSADFELVAAPGDIYDGEALVNGWVNAGGATNFELSDGHLSLVSAANNGWLQHDNDESVWEKGVADGGSWTAEISVRLAADDGNGIVIWGANGAERHILQINTGNTQAFAGAVLDENDNTDAFHTFRLAFEAEDGLYYMWRDGVLLTPDGLAKQAGTGASRFIVGDCCSSYLMTTVDLAYIRYDTTGAFSPGAPAPGVDGLSSVVAGLSTQALDSLVAHYDGKTGVETDGGSVVSWTPIDANGDSLDEMIIVSTQRGGGAPELITYDGSGKLTFDDTDVGADGRYLEGTLSNAESKEFTVFWVGNYSADAPFATSGTYVYNIGINSTSHQRDDGAGGFVVEQYNGTTYAGDDITAYDGVTTVWSTVLTADSHAFYANGENLNVAGTPSNNVKANASMLIGAYSSSGYDFVGEVEQLIIFGSALSDADRELVENYLGATGAPATPPTISVVNNGDGSVTVTFEGRLQAADSVNGPWADVEGATSPLTIPSDQAAQFGRAVK